MRIGDIASGRPRQATAVPSGDRVRPATEKGAICVPLAHLRDEGYAFVLQDREYIFTSIGIRNPRIQEELV